MGFYEDQKKKEIELEKDKIDRFFNKFKEDDNTENTKNNDISQTNSSNNISKEQETHEIRIEKFPLWVIAIFLWSIGVCFFAANNTLIALLAFISGVFVCPQTDKELKKYNFYKNNKSLLVFGIIVLWILCSGNFQSTNTNISADTIDEDIESLYSENTIFNNKISEEVTIPEAEEDIIEEEIANKVIVDTTNKISLSEIPEYKDFPYVEINDNRPFFDDSELTEDAYEKYSDLDELGRVGIACACIRKGMDDKPRENISKVTPTGWQNTKYEGIDGGNLYNRCHLIANQLTGENDNEKNLITGTRYMNTQGMERFENKVAEYIKGTNNHVLYRVTPMFDGNNLLANGVLIEAKSVEDNGVGIEFNVFCYNVQPGINIDYKNGDNSKIEEEKKVTNETTNVINSVNQNVVENVKKDEEVTTNNTTNTVNTEKQISSETSPQSTTPTTTQTTTSTAKTTTPVTQVPAPETSSQETYILNTNTKKFHHSWCSSVGQMKDKNKREYTGTREGVINQGYVPCQRCSP